MKTTCQGFMLSASLVPKYHIFSMQPFYHYTLGLFLIILITDFFTKIYTKSTLHLIQFIHNFFYKSK